MELERNESGGVRGKRAAGRRDFLKKVGVGTAVAWTAPVLASAPASAGPGTPGLQVIDWGNTVLSFGNDTMTSGVVPLGSYPLTATPGTVEFSLTVTQTGASYLDTGSLASGIDGTFPRPANPQSFHVQMTRRGSGPLTLTMAFSAPVTNLSFTVLDIDAASFVDRVAITGTNAGVPTAGTAMPGASVAVITPDEVFQGTVLVANTSTIGDVAFTFAGPIDEVVIVYSRAGSRASQGIGLSDITYNE